MGPARDGSYIRSESGFHASLLPTFFRKLAGSPNLYSGFTVSALRASDAPSRFSAAKNRSFTTLRRFDRRTENLMKLFLKSMFAVALVGALSTPSHSEVLRSDGFSIDNDVAFELIGQVKNSPPAAPGLPATSVQYGYLSFIQGLRTDQIFAAGGPENETTARFTFYNDSTNLRVTPHGKWLIVVREGTTTIYLDTSPDGDLTTPLPDTFRDGIPVQTSTWRHQVIFEPAPSAHFFVTFINTVTSSESFALDGETVRLANEGDKFRINLVGGPDPAGLVTGKFAGTAATFGTPWVCYKPPFRGGRPAFYSDEYRNRKPCLPAPNRDGWPSH